MIPNNREYCCVCGEDITGLVMTPWPGASGLMCCDTCARKYVVPAIKNHVPVDPAVNRRVMEKALRGEIKK